MTLTAQLRDQAVRVAGVVDPDLLTGAQAAAAVEDLATAEKAIASTLMFTALRAAKTDAWQGQGYASAADWFAAKAGVSVFEANRLLGTARRADRLPKTKAAMKKGDLSPDQADAVTDAATADPDAEDDLLGCAARDTHKKLREQAAKRKAAATDAAERERRIRRSRSLRTGTDADGAFWARIYGPGADAARFEAMLRPFEELIFRQHRSAGRRDTHENRRYDALQLMLAYHAHLAHHTNSGTGSGSATPKDGEQPASDDTSSSNAAAPSTGSEAAQAKATNRSRHGAEPDTEAAEPRCEGPTQAGPTGDPTASPTGRGAHSARPGDRSTATGHPPGDPGAGPAGTWSPPWDPDQTIALPAKVPGGDNVKVIVNVDHTALLRGHTTAGETCEIAGIGPVSVHAVRDILRNDPFLAVVVRKGRNVLAVAHHGRGLNAHQRTAIEANGVRCTNIACNRTIAIQIDHRVPYATDPVTHLDNTDPLCTTCHQLKTHHQHHLEPGRGPRRLLPPHHPDNPLTAAAPTHAAEAATGPRGDRSTTGDRAAPTRPMPSSPEGGLPTGKALVELIDRRPLTPAEEHELENRTLQHLIDRGHDITGLRMTKPPKRPAATPGVEQPTLC